MRIAFYMHFKYALNVATDTTPDPPICIRIKITAWSKPVQYVAVFFTTSPVTQTAYVDVNKAPAAKMTL